MWGTNEIVMVFWGNLCRNEDSIAKNADRSYTPSCKMPHNADSKFIANHRLGCCLSHFFKDSKRSASAMMELSPWSSYSSSSSSSSSLPLSVASYEIWERAMRLRESPMSWLFGDCFCAYFFSAVSEFAPSGFPSMSSPRRSRKQAFPPRVSPPRASLPGPFDPDYFHPNRLLCAEWIKFKRCENQSV